ncbi:uncharacterized protein K452DRAFT_313751 [Aplosporella prunicola CBS 121167]|uniref:C2H2-type domain-containing protein n=1 Tax=Aplosporella prunicola CBS 121167 TaxID=1176127 RepID=A0A6A6AVL2_9PEZI|nr:uncharacterized protein K452DRAFT_313751 [Aplosporella prunicola CBS 121167]KAF2135730.1 hypothetical protein K452DRAFT_313751 [Aplosporella prunicola CBS 121167]
MHPGPDSMGAPSSFSARRPNASSLPSFELPPPPMSNAHQKFPSFAPINQPQSSPASGTIGNLLTPPSNLADGMSSHTQASQHQHQHHMSSYNPNGYVWSPPPQGSTPYGFQAQAPATSQSYATPRGQYAPFVVAADKVGADKRTALPPPPYDLNLPAFPSSASMSAPSTLPTMSGQHSSMSSMMSSQNPVTTSAPQHSPIHSQDGYHSHRPPPTPTYHYSSHSSSTPQQSNFPYSTGPSPTQSTPLSAGGLPPRMSPAHSTAQIPSLQSAPSHSPHPYQRPYQSYPLPGPVLSNVNNPSGQLALVGGMPHGMMHGFNSGHAASMQHMYGGHHAAQQAPPNDRPFKCDQCPQSFNRNHDLKRHKRIHLAVKPFPCGHCDKSFSRKDALKRHILVKGCGKASGNDGDKHDGSLSPTDKGDNDHKPVLPPH